MFYGVVIFIFVHMSVCALFLFNKMQVTVWNLNGFCLEIQTPTQPRRCCYLDDVRTRRDSTFLLHCVEPDAPKLYSLKHTGQEVC